MAASLYTSPWDGFIEMLVIPRLAKYGLLMIAVAGGIFVTLVTTRSHRPVVTLRGVNDLIRKELPVGSSKSQVYEFLNSREIMSKGYDVGPDPLYGLAVRERKRYVTARIPQLPDPSLSEYDIFIVFYFDEDQNLIHYEIQQLDNVP